MGKITSVRAALGRAVDIRCLAFFLLLFPVPLDYFLPNVKEVLLFSLVLSFIVKEDAETQYIDMRLAVALLLCSLLLTESPLETFLEALCGWFFFKSFLYATAHFAKLEKEESQHEAEMAEDAFEQASPIPFVPFFVVGVFLAATLWMCVSLPMEETQRLLTALPQFPFFGVPTVVIGTHLVPSILTAAVMACGCLFFLTYARLRWKMHKGFTPKYIFGDGDPIIFAVFFGILPIMIYLTSFAFSLVLAAGAFFLQHKKQRGTSDVPDR